MRFTLGREATNELEVERDITEVALVENTIVVENITDSYKYITVERLTISIDS